MPRDYAIIVSTSMITIIVTTIMIVVIIVVAINTVINMILINVIIIITNIFIFICFQHLDLSSGEIAGITIGVLIAVILLLIILLYLLDRKNIINVRRKVDDVKKIVGFSYDNFETDTASYAGNASVEFVKEDWESWTTYRRAMSQYKDCLSKYMDSRYKDETVVRQGIPVMVKRHLYTETTQISPTTITT